MGRKKDPSEWTANYRRRIEKAFEKASKAGKDITLEEARGHGKPNPHGTAWTDKETGRKTTSLTPTSSPLDAAKYNLGRKEKALNLKETLGKVTPKEAKQERRIIEQMKKSVDSVYKKQVGTQAYFNAVTRAKKNYDKGKKLGLWGQNFNFDDLIFYN